MKISSKTRSALLAVVSLARKEDHVSLSVLSEEESISLMFLEQLFSKLKKNDIVISKRGNNGGYALNKKPQDITVFDIIQAVDPLPVATRCKDNLQGCKSNGSRCSLHYFFKNLDQITFSYFKNTSLQQIIDHNYTQVLNNDLF